MDSVFVSLLNGAKDVMKSVDLPANCSMVNVLPNRSFSKSSLSAITVFVKHIITGHSRGGKTALLAGALEERVRIVNSNESGAGGSGCYRLRVNCVYNNETSGREEQLRDSMEQFPYWYGKDMAQYVDNEPLLPFDLHFIKAMVAPRTLFISEAAGDIWANPFGSWQTTMAAKEVYRFLNAEDNLFWYYRPGYHAHLPVDIEMLVNVILHQKNGSPLDTKMFQLPFQKPELAFDWRCPET